MEVIAKLTPGYRFLDHPVYTLQCNDSTSGLRR